MRRHIAILTVLCFCGICTYAQADSGAHKPLLLRFEKQVFLQPVPSNLSIKHLGFFCRQELLMEKKLVVPVKLRVGNPDDCNYLEQKTAYKIPKQ